MIEKRQQDFFITHGCTSLPMCYRVSHQNVNNFWFELFAKGQRIWKDTFLTWTYGLKDHAKVGKKRTFFDFFKILSQIPNIPIFTAINPLILVQKMWGCMLFHKNEAITPSYFLLQESVVIAAYDIVWECVFWNLKYNQLLIMRIVKKSYIKEQEFKFW